MRTPASTRTVRDFLRLLKDFKESYEIKHWSTVAKIGGVPRTTMADWIAKRNPPSLEHVISVANRIEAAQLALELIGR